MNWLNLDELVVAGGLFALSAIALLFAGLNSPRSWPIGIASICMLVLAVTVVAVKVWSGGG